MRDAIVYSGSGWEACNVLERLSVALSKLGANVLYCDNPSSILKGKRRDTEKIRERIARFRPSMYGHRLNQIDRLALLQSRKVAKQIIRAAEKLSLRNPMFFYSYTGRLLPLCCEMKRRSHFLVHVCMDYPELDMREHAAIADLTLVIPRAALDPIQKITGGKAALIPQLGPPEPTLGPPLKKLDTLESQAVALRNIPRPRLIYAGALQNRVLLPVVRDILQAMPQWQFLHFGSPKSLPLPNAHTLPWMSAAELDGAIRDCDIGFMPYNCSNPVEYNCVPLKLLDYFAAGIPVVSTPIASMSGLKDVVYLGGTAPELMAAIELALSEPADSPKRARRAEIAHEHSLDNIAALLYKILPFEG